MNTLITSAAEFIGMNSSFRLLDRSDEVIGIDNPTDYYDVSLKQARLARLEPHAKFGFHKIYISDRDAMANNNIQSASRAACHYHHRGNGGRHSQNWGRQQENGGIFIG